MKLSCICGLLALACAASSGAGAETNAERQSDLYRNSVAQDGLRKDADAIHAQILSMRDEAARLAPGEVKLLEEAMRRLDEVTRGEMSRATEALQAASQSKDPAVQSEKLKAAARDQTAVREKLKRISADLSARQTLAKVVPSLLELLLRQCAAEAEVARIAQTKTDPARLVSEAMKDYPIHERYRSITAEQDGIAEETAALVKRLEEIANKLPPEMSAAPARAAKAARDQALDKYADAAAKSLRGAPFQTVLDSQKAVERGLFAMIATLQPIDQRLAFVLGELDDLLKMQTEIADGVAALPEKKPILPVVSQRQRDGCSRTMVLALALHDIAERALPPMENARDAMEKSAAVFEKNDKAAVPPLQKAVIDNLTAVKETLAKLASREAPATRQQLAQELARLSRETAQAAAEQKRAAPTPPLPPLTPEQKETLRNKVQDLQEQALKTDQDVAKALGAAAEKMKQPDAAPQQQAARDLAQLSQDLANRAAALNGQLPEQQALARMESQVAQTAKDLQAEQARMESGKQASADAVNQLAALQPQIAAEQQAAAAARAPAETQAALSKAKQALQEAALNAAQTKMDAAKASAQRSQNALQQAQQNLTQAREAIAQTALPKDASGQPMQPGANQQHGLSSSQDPASALPQSDRVQPETAQAGADIQTGDDRQRGGGNDRYTGRGAEGGPAQVVTGLQPKDREAITLLQGEKPPREFETQVQQYYKNLADGVGN